MPRKPDRENIQETLLKLARPKMSPKDLLRETRKVHPEATKKDIVRAAFASIIAVADSDVEKALALQNFALHERAGDEQS
jgi:hypothetical protein